MESVIPKTFTLFPQLPYEIRLKIWRFAIPGPRVVPLHFELRDVTSDGKPISKFSPWRSSDPVPVVLHICHDARAEALKSLGRAFGTHFHEPQVYVNFDIDTILFGSHFDTLRVNGPLQIEKPSDYLLDVFLDSKSHGVNDANKIQRMILDINDSIYGRTGYC
jgi:hypothetical protein